MTKPSPREPRRSRTSPKRLLAVTGALLVLAARQSQAQEAPAVELTVEHPIAISVEPLQRTLPPGSKTYLVLSLTTPEGIWVGAAEGEVRSPGRTVLELPENPFVRFEPPRWPEPHEEGIPPNLGTTRIYSGRIRVVIPFEVAPTAPPGERRIALKITYTPGVNGGHLSPHIDEEYETKIEVSATAPAPVAAEPRPEVAPSTGLRVKPATVDLPMPLGLMVFQLSEENALSLAMHTLWEDPEDHGKHVLMGLFPFVGGTKNSGTSFGGGAAVMNVTREGIGTGLTDARVFYNEYVRTEAALDIVSCPGAFHNYWFSGFLAADRTTRGARLHVEDLTWGDNRFGYETQISAFSDGTYRFFGLGPGTTKSDESAFTQREFSGDLDLYWNVAPYFRLGLGGRARYVEVKDPAKLLGHQVPSTLDLYPGTPGSRGGAILGERVTLVFDRRNQEFTPTHGTYVRVRFELDHNANDHGDDLAPRWGRIEVLARQYFSTPGERFTLVLSNGWKITDHHLRGPPFWELPTLGGNETLRAFDEGRFGGQDSFFASVELRAQVFHMVMLEMPMDLELAPFVDVGQVFDSHGFHDRFNVNPGMSMRILSRPNVGLVTNVAYGQDGVLVSGSLGLPF